MKKIHTTLVKKTAGAAVLALAAACPAAEIDAAGEAGRTMFEQFVWPGGGVIGLILIVLNVATWALIIEHLSAIRRRRLCPADYHERVRGLLAKRDFRAALELSAADGSLLASAVLAALQEAAGGLDAMQRALVEEVDLRATNLLRRIEALNIIGNLAPMLGLMGTVLGMILAFNRIVEDGGAPDAGRLADAIGLALVTTFWGLVVAVPAMAAWSVLRNRVDALAAEATADADELIASLRPAERRP